MCARSCLYYKEWLVVCRELCVLTVRQCSDRIFPYENCQLISFSTTIIPHRIGCCVVLAWHCVTFSCTFRDHLVRPCWRNMDITLHYTFQTNHAFYHDTYLFLLLRLVGTPIHSDMYTVCHAIQTFCCHCTCLFLLSVVSLRKPIVYKAGSQHLLCSRLPEGLASAGPIITALYLSDSFWAE